MTLFRSAVLLGSLALLLLTAPAHAQKWGQEVQAITAAPFGGPVHVFLDSLSTVLENNPGILVNRSDRDGPVPFRKVQEDLNSEGIDLRSASHVYIRYQFDYEQGGLTETIQDLLFVFRLEEAHADLPILYVKAKTPVVRNLLLKKGVPSKINPKSFTPFRKVLSFMYMHVRQEAMVVEMGREALRDELDPRITTLVDFLTDEVYGPEGKGYTLATP